MKGYSFSDRGPMKLFSSSGKHGWLQWEWLDWSLSYHHSDNMWKSLFALRCIECRRFTLGCSEHWLCGVCQDCKRKVDPE